MNTKTLSITQQAVKEGSTNSNWKTICQIGGISALGIVFVALAEILITFLPGGYTVTEIVTDWFKLLHDNWFMGVRGLGLLNIVMTTLGIPLFLTLYLAHRDRNQAFAALAMVLSFIGAAVFFATNRAFVMWELSTRYWAATSDAQRAALEVAGQAMLSVGQSHTPGTFMAFFLGEVSGILMAIVMLHSKVFHPVTAYVGIIAYGCFFIFEILSSFVPSAANIVLIPAMIGGLGNIAWYILIAIRFFQLGQD